MLEIKTGIFGENSFVISYKGKEFFTHTIKKPLIVIGKGNGEFKDRKGVFRIKDTIISKDILSKFEITSDNQEKIVLKFDDFLTLKFEIIDNRLEISIDNLNSDYNRIWLNINAENDEKIYGCGEQFSEFNLRGKTVPLWIQEQGICRGDPKLITWLLNLLAGVGGSWYTTYHTQPTFISTENYSFHAESTVYAIFDFKNPKQHILEFWGNPKKILIDKQQNLLNTIERLSSYLGRQPQLPDWIYDGMWLAVQGKGGLDAVRKRVKKAIDAGIKVSAIWSQDWEGIKVTSFGTQLFWDWKWDGGGRLIRFPDFPKFVKEFNDRGIKYIGYINSFLNTEGDLYKEAKEKNYCVKNPNGEDYMITVTTFPAGLVDLTNPDAYEWIKNVIKKNMIEEAGLEGWMSDFGEYLPADAVLHSGISAREYHNQYPVDWQKANLEAITEAGKLHEIVFFTRSGYSGTSKYSTFVWAGDQTVNWSMDDGLASVIPSALSLGVCGIGYHHSDIGGYTTFKPFFTRKKELFMRWAEQATFTMLMRTHESNQPENNVQFDTDDEILSHLAKMTKIHVGMKNYLISLSIEYQNTGIPPIRPIFLHYPNDEVLYKRNLQYQYLLGKDLIIAPVIKPKNNKWKVYLPNDEWIHLWSHQTYSQGWHSIESPLGEPPVFFRKKSDYKQLFEELKYII